MELDRRAADIVNGVVVDRVTTADVTPGGGKSLAIALMAKRLIDAGLIEKVVWVTPRISLSHQAANGFQEEDHNPGYSLRIGTNLPPFFRDAGQGCVGYTTTYQAVAANPDLHLQAFQLHPGKVLLVLDEVQHLRDDGEGGEAPASWAAAIEPLVALSYHTLCTSGTLERHDRVRVPFISYERNEHGSEVPVRHVRYSRREALAERAILPIQFHYEEGLARYRHHGREVQHDVGTAEANEASRVVRTILSDPDFREAIIRRGLEDWRAFCESTYRSRAIVVCADQDTARGVADFVRDQFQVGVTLAISDEPRSAEEIRRFREQRSSDVLVTVGMAYEGLDVPDCTHLICLTRYRSRPWLEQAFARVTRVDYAAVRRNVLYDEQHAFVYVPNDPEMQRIVAAIREEQEQGLRELEVREEREAGEGEDLEESEVVHDDFVPIAAQSTGVTYGTADGVMSREDNDVIEDYRDQFPTARAWPASVLLGIIRRAQGRPSGTVTEAVGRIDVAMNDAPTVPQRRDPYEENRLRESTQNLANRLDRLTGADPGTTNRRIADRYGASRRAMGLQQLREVEQQLHREEREVRRNRGRQTG